MNGQGIDPAKVFILAMSVVIAGLAVAILLTFLKVGAYEENFAAAKKTDFKKLAEEVEACKVFKKRADEAGAINLDSPIQYINENAQKAKISPLAYDYSSTTKGRKRDGYTETTYLLQFKEGVPRDKLAAFLFYLEKGSSILKISRLDFGLSKAAKNAVKKEEELDDWQPTVHLSYRKSYVP